jgi:hypothetical protein
LARIPVVFVNKKPTSHAVAIGSASRAQLQEFGDFLSNNGCAILAPSRDERRFLDKRATTECPAVD